MLVLVCILLVPLAMAGLALIHAGLGRSRSAAHGMLSSLCVTAIAAIVFVTVGHSVAGTGGGVAHHFQAGGAVWDWMGAGRLLLRGADLDGASLQGFGPGMAICLQMFAVGLAALIPLSAGADRWRLGAVCASSAVFAAVVYPLFAHWVWGGGWLAQLGANFGLGVGFVDLGGSGTIHVVGASTALAIAWILGPRKAKYGGDGVAAAIPGHNMVIVLLGCMLATLGWMGLNAAGAMLFYGVASGRVVLIVINTMLCASGAVLAAVATTRVRFGKPDASLSANGWVGGLVASSAGCAVISPIAAIVIGVVAGALITLSVELLETRLRVDDPGGAVSVHGVGGVWGLFAVGIFGSWESGVAGGQMLAQVVGVATLVGFILPLTYSLNWLLNLVLPQRVERYGERQGMDVHELGAGAYPEFVVHIDEFEPD